MGLQFLKYELPYPLILIESPQTKVTCQELINAIRDFEDSSEGMDIPKLADASGKEEIDDGLFQGITLKLYDWKIKFEGRAGPDWVSCEAGGGNLVCWDSTLKQFINPIANAPFITATRTLAVSATISDVDAVDLQYLKDQIDKIKKETGLIPATL